jgi:hypothetical protein
MKRLVSTRNQARTREAFSFSSPKNIESLEVFEPLGTAY